MTTTAEKILDRLRSFDLREEGVEQGSLKYRSNSPLRPGSNSHAFKLVVHPGGESGAFCDHAGGEEGSLYDLADALGIEHGDGRKEVASTKRAYADMEDYARAHGVTGEVLAKAGWKSVTYEGRKALSFQTRGGVRYRFIDGGEKSYTNVEGYKKCWYGLNRAVEIATEKQSALILCNGEISTVVAQHYGLPACCVTSGEGRIPTDLLPELNQKWTGDIWVTLDCDDTGRKAAEKIKEQLPRAQIIDLMLGDKGDLADFCLFYPEQTLTHLSELLAEPQEQPGIQSLLKGVQELARLRKQGRSDGIETEQVVEQLRRELSYFERKNQSVKTLRFEDAVVASTRSVSAAVSAPRAVLGLHSHLPTVDKILGGWRGGRTHIIYGDTNMGKSTLVACIAAALSEQAPGCILSTESPPLFWFNKLAAAIAHVPTDRIESGELSPEEYNRLLDAYDKLAESRSTMLDATSPTPAMLRKAVLDAAEADNIGWVAVDSLSKMKVPGITDIYDTTKICADELQDIAISTGLMILATCQIGRNVKDRSNKMPQLNDALGAGTVEQNADVVMSIYRHDYYVRQGTAKPSPNFPPNSALLRVLKHRWKALPEGGVMLTMIGGASFFELEDGGVPF